MTARIKMNISPPNLALVAMILTLGSAGACQVKVGGRTAQEIFTDQGLAKLAEAAGRGDKKEIDQLIRAGVPVDGVGAEDMTPLSFALFAHNAEGVETLLNYGANPNHCIKARTNAEGKLPIILFLQNSQDSAFLELLLKHGADPNTRQPVKDQSFPYRGESLLIQSVMSMENVKILVKYGADVNIVPQSSEMVGGISAIEVAAQLGQFDVVEYLLNHGALHLDEVAHTLQFRAWSPEAKPRRLRLLGEIHARGGRIYSQYKPIRSLSIVRYSNIDTPAEWITPGYYECKEFKGEHPVDLKK